MFKQLEHDLAFDCPGFEIAPFLNFHGILSHFLSNFCLRRWTRNCSAITSM